MVDYTKWDKLEISDDSDEDTTPSPSFRSSAGNNNRALVVSIAWDVFSEKLRWGMDRHKIPYLEKSYPYGFHLFATISFSKPIPASQQTFAPVLQVSKSLGETEIYRDTTDQFVYLMSKSLGSSLRLYPTKDVLDLEISFDRDLAPLAMTIFYYVVFSSRALEEKYIFKAIRLERVRTLYKLIWPFMKLHLRFKYNANEKGAREAYDKVSKVYEKVDRLLEKSKKQFIHSEQFTAADLTFACHSAPILLASQEDIGSHLAMYIPSMKEAPAWVFQKVQELRQTPSAHLAIRMYKKERGSKSAFRIKESRYDLVNRPWWTHKDMLVPIVWGSIALFVILEIIFYYLVSPFFALFIFMALLSGMGYGSWKVYNYDKELFERLWFAKFGKAHDPPKKTLEQIQKEKQKERENNSEK